MSSTKKIAVVIPFFQREAGILGKALRSIAEQRYPKNFLYTVVIDDGSPLSAEAEIDASRLRGELNVRVIRQANAGPNEARNAGLESLDPDTDVVAYLDSDDEWINDHLRRGVSVLADGFSAYFTNLFHLGDSIPEFEKARRVDPDKHPQLSDPTLHRYVGDMAHQVVTANIIFMPTLMIDFKALGHVRFPFAHRHGGGDYLYWLALIEQGAVFAFSTQAEVRCGRGINMWYASGWGTDGLARRILDEARFRQRAVDQYIKDPETQEALRSRIASLQDLLLRDVIHRLRRGQKVDWQAVRAAFTEVEVSPLRLAGHLWNRDGAASRHSDSK